MIRKNLSHLKELIAAKCLSAGREVDSVTLIAVSKLFGTDHMREAISAGQIHFGENYAWNSGTNLPFFQKKILCGIISGHYKPTKLNM
ncbi:MAG: hypothetical protein IPN18_19770 [Ignavibacteriales bacterium]|nr:hypothetical protein [Ignavibacteriales bacterium]